MALQSPLWGSTGAFSELGRGDPGHSRAGSNPNRVGLSDGERPGRVLGLSLVRTIGSVQGESSSKSATELRQVGDPTEGNVSRRLRKDLSSFPRGSKFAA